MLGFIIYGQVAALVMLVLMILMNLLVGILPHVDNFAHIGGFITGFFLGFILLARPQLDWIVPPGYYGHPMKPQYKLYQYVLIVLSVIALIVIFTTGFVFLYRKIDGNNYCSWCHYLSCVPTPLWSCDPQCNVRFCDNLVREIARNINLFFLYSRLITYFTIIVLPFIVY
ncbi:putative peptidase S54, rhomboid, Rhomboid-like superfamily [Helianthus anomalus]